MPARVAHLAGAHVVPGQRPRIDRLGSALLSNDGGGGVKGIVEDASNSLFKLRVITVPLAASVICMRFTLFVSRKEPEGEYMDEEGKNG